MMKEVKQESLADLIEYKKRARYMLMKLHKELEKKDEEIKLLEQINGILRNKLERKNEGT